MTKWSTCFNYQGLGPHPSSFPSFLIQQPGTRLFWLLASPLWSTMGSHIAACTIPGADVLWLCFQLSLNIFHLLLLLLWHRNTLNQCFHRTYCNHLQVIFLSSRTKMINLCLAMPNIPPHHFEISIWDPIIQPVSVPDSVWLPGGKLEDVAGYRVSQIIYIVK